MKFVLLDLLLKINCFFFPVKISRLEMKTKLTATGLFSSIKLDFRFMKNCRVDNSSRGKLFELTNFRVGHSLPEQFLVWTILRLDNFPPTGQLFATNNLSAIVGKEVSPKNLQTIFRLDNFGQRIVLLFFMWTIFRGENSLRGQLFALTNLPVGHSSPGQFFV